MIEFSSAILTGLFFFLQGSIAVSSFLILQHIISMDYREKVFLDSLLESIKVSRKDGSDGSDLS